MPRFRAPYSYFALLLLALLMVQVRLWTPYWATHNVQAILTWDVMGYYLYLPAHFIYHDLSHLNFIPDILREYQPTGSFYQAFQVAGAPEGTYVMKYPVGLAVLLTPFFWLGHWAAALGDYPQDGFSAPYQVAIAFGSILYALLGLGVLRRVLLRYVSDGIVAVTLLALVLGTNYFEYSTVDAAMPHNFLFTLYSLLLLATIEWHARPRYWLAAAIGLLLGLMVLCRPSEAVAALLPLLWGIDSWAAARRKLVLLRTHAAHVALLVLMGALGVLPQLLYWKWATGHFIVYSYEDQGFSFLKPHTWQVLFSFRKGWLIYTPLMSLAVAGLFVLWRQRRVVAVPVLVYFIINLWVVSAWDIWWYGGGFGQRALVQSYAVLALPFAFLLAWAFSPARRVVIGPVLAVIMVLCIDLNLLQHWQFLNGIIAGDDMSRRYYWAVFNKIRPTQDDYAVFDNNRPLPLPLARYTRQVLGALTFEDEPVSAETGITAERGYYSAKSYQSTSTRKYSPALTVSITPDMALADKWLRISTWVYSDWGAWGNKLILSIERGGESIQWAQAQMQNAGTIGGRWSEIWFYARCTPQVQPGDVLKVFVLNEGAGCTVDQLQAEVLTPAEPSSKKIASSE